jgi:hypothetical protein
VAFDHCEVDRMTLTRLKPCLPPAVIELNEDE